MKIYYIGDFKNQYTTENCIAESLNSLGQEVIKSQEMTFDEEKIKVDLGKFNPDVLFFAKGRILGGVEALESVVQSFDGKKVFWLFDKMYGFPKDPSRAEWMDRIGPLVDHAFVTDNSCAEEYDRAGINYHILRQGFMQGQNFKGKSKKDFQGFDVGFIGSVYEEERRNLIDFVKKHFNFIIRGNKDMYELRGQSMCDFCFNVPIILGDNFGSAKDYWSNRIYNVLGSRGFFIGSRVKGLEEEFTEREHFVGYDKGDFKRLRQKIEFYLERPELRKEIAQKGKKHVLENHTYKKRCEKLLEVVN